MREYVKARVYIDGRNIPYPVYTANEYLVGHDKLAEDEVESFAEVNGELFNRLSQVIALKQSCYLLRHTSYSCGSLSDSLYSLKKELISEIREKYNYQFDDEWMDSLVKDYL